jgi:imidazolonepropionase-like amidohydrolase
MVTETPKPKLTVVAGIPTVREYTPQEMEAQAPQTIGQRVRALQAEAKALAREHVMALSASLGEVQATAAEIAGGGDAYPAGVRDLARRFADECEARAQTLEAILSKS